RVPGGLPVGCQICSAPPGGRRVAVSPPASCLAVDRRLVRNPAPRAILKILEQPTPPQRIQNVTVIATAVTVHEQARVAVGKAQARIAIAEALAVRRDPARDERGAVRGPLGARTSEREGDVAG